MCVGLGTSYEANVLFMQWSTYIMPEAVAAFSRLSLCEIWTPLGSDGKLARDHMATEFHRSLGSEIENFTWSQICVERLNAFPKSPGIVVSLQRSWMCHPSEAAAILNRTSSAADRICNKAPISLPLTSFPRRHWRCAKKRFKNLWTNFSSLHVVKVRGTHWKLRFMSHQRFPVSENIKWAVEHSVSDQMQIDASNKTQQSSINHVAANLLRHHPHDETWTHSKESSLDKKAVVAPKVCFGKYQPEGCSVNAFQFFFISLMINWLSEVLSTIQNKNLIFCWMGCFSLIVIPTKLVWNSDEPLTLHFYALSSTSKLWLCQECISNENFDCNDGS